MGSIPDSTWHDPYVVGFLAMLITMIATRAAGSLGSNDLAAVQSKAWGDITGMPGHLFGEEICFYDAAHDNRFTFGCRNAELFLHELDVAKYQSEQKLSAGAAVTPSEPDVTSALWSHYFDAYLGEPLPISRA
ncbi:MAG: hypothetical protein ACM3W7_08495 [Acidobacteriota bacterium]